MLNHILRKEIVDYFSGRAINLHASLLPWNRGADPNLWSFLENTPKGVTIHEIGYGIDTGKILAQREMSFSSSHTLRTSYEELHNEIVNIFIETWPALAMGLIKPRSQETRGSFHFTKDKERYQSLLTNGWDTRIGELKGKAIGNNIRK